MVNRVSARLIAGAQRVVRAAHDERQVRLERERGVQLCRADLVRAQTPAAEVHVRGARTAAVKLFGDSVRQWQRAVAGHRLRDALRDTVSEYCEAAPGMPGEQRPRLAETQAVRIGGFREARVALAPGHSVLGRGVVAGHQNWDTSVS